MLKSARETLAQCLAGSYWKSLRSTSRRYLEFKATWEERNGGIPHDLALIYWVEKKRTLDGITAASALQYTMDVAGALRRTSGVSLSESQLLQDYRRSLRRSGALIPGKQATPAGPHDVTSAVRLEPKPLTRLAVEMCWVTAGRASDVLRLKRQEVNIRADGVVTVHWRETKGDPFQLGRFTGHHVTDGARATLSHRLKAISDPTGMIFPPGITSSQIGAALQRVNRSLTSHSLRRGAAQFLLKQKVPLDELCFLTRHQTTESLIRYVAEAGATAGGRDGSHVGKTAGSHVRNLLRGNFPGVPWIPGNRARYRPEGDGCNDDGDMGPGLDTLYDEALAISIGGKPRRPPHKGGKPNEDYIASICVGFMDLHQLKILDQAGELQGVIDVITDPGSFYARFWEGELQRIRSDARFRMRISRNLLHHLDALKQYEVLEEVSHEPKVVLHGFTVEKKSGGRRFVLDGRKLNDCMQPPQDMLLPRIVGVIGRLLQANWVVATDGKSWFYQFPVHPEIRDFFGVKVAPQRGNFVTTRLKALCMGWKYAPCIAQRTARVLLPPSEGVTWVDNFIVTAGSQQEAAEKFEIFLTRCATVNAKMSLDEQGYGQPTQMFNTFGLSFDLQRHCYRSDPAWVQKFLGTREHAAVRGGRATPRAIYKVVGGLVWHSYTTNSFLCFLPATLSFIRDVARDLFESAEWDTPIAVRPSAIKEIEQRSAQMTENPWIGRGPTTCTTAWSDASSTSWAAILESDPQQVAQAAFSNGKEMWHIYVKELYAARQAIALASKSLRATRIKLMVDNLPAVHSIQRGHSSDFRSNHVIADLFTLAAGAQLQVVCEWVSTSDQRADQYTRGVTATDPVLLPE